MLDLILVEPRNSIRNYPRQGPAEVDDLVRNDGHDARGEDIILHVRIPRGPHPLREVEMDIV